MHIKTALLGTMLAGAFALPLAASATTVDGINVVPGATFVLSNLFEEAVPTVNSDGTYTDVFGNTISSVSGSPFVGAGSSRVISSQGQILRGIASVSAIQNGSGQNVWVSGQNGAYLTLAFDDYVTESISGGSPPIDINFSSGVANFYASSTNTFNAGATIDGNTADEFTSAMGGALWLSMTGGNTGLTTSSGDFNGTGVPITLQGIINAGSLTSIGSGSGLGLLDVTGGDAGSLLNTNTFPNGTDVSISSSFNNAPPVGDFTLSGSTTFKFNAIPEPASLVIMAIGLLSLGFLARTKKSRSNNSPILC